MTNLQGGLALPDFIGINDTELEELKEKHDTFDEVELTMTRLGFNPKEKPRYQCPELTPEILATVNMQQYSSTYTQFNSWHSYAHNVLARLKAHRLGIEHEMSSIGRHIRMSAHKNKGAGKGPSKDYLADLVESNPRYAQLSLEKQKLDQQVTLTESNVDSLERDLRLISRQVELLRMEHDAGMVGSNLPQRGRAPGRLT